MAPDYILISLLIQAMSLLLWQKIWDMIKGIFFLMWQRHFSTHKRGLSWMRVCDIFTEQSCLSLCLSVCVRLCPESTDEEVDKLHCLNHSGSSATYSDYSPSQGSSGSSNPPANTHSHTLSHTHQHNPAMQAPSKDQAPQTHWTNRYTHTHTHRRLLHA